MLKVIIEAQEYFDESKREFFTADEVVVELEHSLLSLSKWESKYQKPFLSGEKKTLEEARGYLKAMVISSDVDPDVLERCSKVTIDKIQEYIDSSQSATVFGFMPERRGLGETITSELIYYWMVAFNIPFEVETWHLNRLFSLIRICNMKNSKPRKMSKHELAQRNREINEKRKKELGTRG